MKRKTAIKKIMGTCLYDRNLANYYLDYAHSIGLYNYGAVQLSTRWRGLLRITSSIDERSKNEN